jgi:protein ImuA
MQDMATALDISRKGAKPRPAHSFLGTLRLDRGRVHEFCGPARRSLALMAAGDLASGQAVGQAGGPVLWIAPGWIPERLNAEGVLPFLNPGRLIFVLPKRPDDLLWVMEEALRSGAVPLVVADLPEPPALTPVRRLQLAAETGAATGTAPLGLILTPGDGGASGVESRWHLAPAHGVTTSNWQLQRRRARMEPPRQWLLRQGPSGVRLME